MASKLEALLHILPDERRKILHFALFAALMQAGVTMGMTVADSLFLTHLGAQKLPIVYLCMPIVMTLYAPVYSALLARLGIDRVVRLTLAVLVTGGIGFGLGAQFIGETSPVYLYAGKLYAGLWFIALYTLYWNFTDDFFSILDGKRIYGVIAAGGSLGGIVGASLVAVLTEILPPARLYFGWAFVALLAFPVFGMLRRRHAKIDPEEAHPDETPSTGEVLRSVMGTFRTSRFAAGLAVACFAAVSLSGMLEYLSMGVLAQGKSPAELARLLGEMHAVANGITLLVNLVLFGRIVGRIGVGNTALVLPVVYLAAFVVFYLRAGPIAAVLAFYAYQSVLPGIEYNNVNLLFNGLPARVKPQVRTFVEAMAEPLATAFTGLFLLSLALRIGTGNVALSGLLAACAALGVAFLVRFDYVGALARNLRRDWLNFADSARDWAAAIGDDDRALLRAKAAQGSRREQLVAVDLLWRARDARAPDALLAALAAATPGEIPRLRDSIAALLQSEDPEIIARVSLWLEGDGGPSAPELVDEFTAAGLVPLRRLQAWRRSQQAPHRATAAVAQWQSSRLEGGSAALEIARDLLAGNPLEKRWALRAIGDFGQKRLADEVLRFLEDPEPAVRREALRSLGRLASAESAHLNERVLPLVDRASPDERRLILRVVCHVGDPAALTPLLRASSSFSTTEARELEGLVVELGLKTIPTVIHFLRDAAGSYHGRSIAARALSRLAMPQLLLLAEDLIATELDRARGRALAFRALAAGTGGNGRGLAVLARYYRDIAVAGLEFALELLSLVGRMPDYDLIRASLSFANPKDRANAIETIQQSCGRAQFEQILFVITNTGPAAPEHAAGPLAHAADVVIGASGSPSHLEAAAGLVAGLELGIEGVRERWRERFSRGDTEPAAPSFLALLPSPSSADGGGFDSIVGRIAALLQSRFFRDARVPALEFLAENASVRPYVDGERVYDQGEEARPLLYVVAEGRVTVSKGERDVDAGRGAVFGERVLMGETRRTERAVARGAVLVALPAGAVTRAIEIFPALGISLYRFKTISAVA